MELLVPLYELRAYDEADPRWSPVYHFQNVTGDAGAATTGAAVSPPSGKSWIITGSTLQLTPDAADTAASGRLRIAPVGGTAILAEPHTFRPPVVVPVGSTIASSLQHNFLVVGGVHQLNVIFGWITGNANNQGIWTVVGYEIPRGNVTLR